MDRRDSADRIEPALANEPTEKTQPNEATEPIDRIDPAEPMLKIEPEEPIDRIDPLDPMLRIEPAEPAGRRELPVIPMPRFSHPGRRAYASASPALPRGGNARVNADPAGPVRTSTVPSFACATLPTIASPSPAPGIPRARGAR